MHETAEQVASDVVATQEIVRLRNAYFSPQVSLLQECLLNGGLVLQIFFRYDYAETLCGVGDIGVHGPGYSGVLHLHFQVRLTFEGTRNDRSAVKRVSELFEGYFNAVLLGGIYYIQANGRPRFVRTGCDVANLRNRRHIHYNGAHACLFIEGRAHLRLVPNVLIGNGNAMLR